MPRPDDKTTKEQYLADSNTPGIVRTRDMDHRNMSRTEAKAAIGEELGRQCASRSRLTKETLNSAYLALTGDTLIEWKKIGTTESMDKGEMMFRVAIEAGFNPDEHLVPEVRGSQSPRPYRLPELRALVYALRSSDDKRPHGDL